MNKNEGFVAYEYKDITIKRNSVAMYTDCLSNFGWELVGSKDCGLVPEAPIASGIVSATTSFATQMTPDSKANELDLVTMQYKRDQSIGSEQAIKKLEQQCADALAAVSLIEKKNDAVTMGISLGVGIAGTAFLGLAVYNFIFSNLVTGVLFALVGFAGAAIGFIAYKKGGKKRTAQSEAKVQEQLDIANNACEKAHTLLTA